MMSKRMWLVATISSSDTLGKERRTSSKLGSMGNFRLKDIVVSTFKGKATRSIELSSVDLTVLFRSYATSFCSKWSKLSKPVRINRVFCRLRLVSLITVTVMNIESKFRSFFSLTCIFNSCAPPKTKTSVVFNPIHHLLNNILILLTHRVLDSKSNNIQREK